MDNSEIKKAQILIVDDDAAIRDVLFEFLSESYHCLAVDSAERALELFSERQFDLMLTDITMNRMSGLDMIPEIRARSPKTVVVMISGQQTINFAIEALRAGAFDYLTKPFDLGQVGAVVRRALDHHQALEAQLVQQSNLEDLVRQRTAEVARMVSHDQLTQLPSRISFEESVCRALSVARRMGKKLGVIFFALDQFKSINDTLGHSVGDLLVKSVAERLGPHFSGHETIARFDADTFALLKTDVSGPNDLVELSRSIANVLKPAFLFNGHELFVTASIGIGMFPGNGIDCQTLLKNAVAALNRARVMGGNNYQFYASDMNRRALQRLSLESGLRRAVQKNEFVVYYQPQVDIESRKIIGTEALVRWQHPQFGMLGPTDFIGVAEETGIISEIGAWVLWTACAQTKQWQQQGLASLNVAVNVSPRQFQDEDFMQTVQQTLRATGLEPRCLELELTETCVMRNRKSTVDTLNGLRAFGVKIAIDDFGTGYSSLGYLKHLPIDYLKLDRSFVAGITTDSDDAALVMTMMTLAHNLKLRVVAEGVETEGQADFLRLLRCQEGQGYLFSRPVPAEAFAALRGSDSTKPHTAFQVSGSHSWVASKSELLKAPII
jgi:diguanylate cyclase